MGTPLISIPEKASRQAPSPSNELFEMVVCDVPPIPDRTLRAVDRLMEGTMLRNLTVANPPSPTFPETSPPEAPVPSSLVP